MDYIADIEARKAVRTFDATKELTDSEIAQIREAIEASTSPFGGDIAVKLHKFDLKGKLRPSTYGSVEGASWYILVGAPQDDSSLLTLGYRMEQVALKIVDMGLGTNFMTDTFRSGVFADAASFPASTPLHVIMPVGVPAGKERLVEKLTHMALKSRSRKPFEETFGNVPQDSIFRQPLEMMRLAPSAYNKQPWRAVVEPGTVLFYLVPADDAAIGMGAGLANFYLALKQNGHDGQFSKPEGAPAKDGCQPIAKFTIQNTAD